MRLPLGVVAVAVVALAGCGSEAPRSAPSGGRAVDPRSMAAPPPVINVVATVKSPSIPVYDVPGAVAPVRSLSSPRPSGAPLVLLVKDQTRLDWLEVYLPFRPNGSTGWVRSSDVDLATHDFRIVVDLGDHRMKVWEGDTVVYQEAVGVGTENTPTPGGLYYTLEVLEPQDAQGRPAPDGPYGPYAYALSGFSEVLYDFAGGEGQIGIHGTNNPAGLGKDASYGCIHVSNEGMTRLVQILPLGVPVEIRP